MRVITGTARGRKLKTLEGEDVRPTTDRVKEALFSIIQFDIEGRNFLDLFAGSGQLGIEALSRGARRAVFVDESKRSISVVRDNIAACKMNDSAQIVQSEARAYLSRCREKFDIAVLDPPYEAGLLPQVLPLTAAVMNKGGTILCEAPDGTSLPEEAGDFVRRRSYRYGKICLTMYRHREME